MKIRCRKVEKFYVIDYYINEDGYSLKFSHAIKNQNQYYEFRDLVNSIGENLFCRADFGNIKVLSINKNTIFSFINNNKEFKILMLNESICGQLNEVIKKINFNQECYDLVIYQPNRFNIFMNSFYSSIEYIKNFFSF